MERVGIATWLSRLEAGQDRAGLDAAPSLAQEALFAIADELVEALARVVDFALAVEEVFC